jgi:molybdopterin-containing oxidoreductase family iron-sulfur binding subunit
VEADKDKGGLSRRQFITRTAGVAGALAVLSSPFLAALSRVKASTQPEGEVVPGEKVRQWCMVIDLRKCEGCVTIDAPPQCTQACTLMHYVPIGQQWIQVFQVELSGGGSYFMPVPCMQCENAPCVNVCPVAATYHTREGIVLIDQRRCIGCRMCMAACPYQRRFFNWSKPDLPPEAAFAEYTPERQVPAIVGTVMKCDFCPDMMRQGRLPPCASGCPMRAIYMGDLNDDIASNGREIVLLSKFLNESDAFRHKEELGTQPRVWYVPGHGQEFGRKADDPRPMIPPTWDWGQNQQSHRGHLWPWGGGSQ